MIVRNIEESEIALTRLLNMIVVYELPVDGHSIISYIVRVVVVVFTVSVAMGLSLFWYFNSTTSMPRMVSSTLRVLI